MPTPKMLMGTVNEAEYQQESIIEGEWDMRRFPTPPEILEGHEGLVNVVKELTTTDIDQYGPSMRSFCVQDHGLPIFGPEGTKVLMARMTTEEEAGKVVRVVGHTRYIREGKALVARTIFDGVAGEVLYMKAKLEKLGIPTVDPPEGVQFEGGDVVRVDQTLFVRNGGRTNQAAINWIRSEVEAIGYTVHEVVVANDWPVHLTTACTYAGKSPKSGRHVLVANPAWVDTSQFTNLGFDVIEVPSNCDEKYAANVLPLSGKVLVQAKCPVTLDRLEKVGFECIEIDWGWQLRIEAKVGFTCCCFILDPNLG